MFCPIDLKSLKGVILTKFESKSYEELRRFHQSYSLFMKTKLTNIINKNIIPSELIKAIVRNF